ncbi:MAG: DUF1592 domain-containing protein [Sandaracinus sp.]
MAVPRPSSRSFLARSLLLSGAVLALTSCVGSVDDGPMGPPGSHTMQTGSRDFTCTPGTAQDPAIARLSQRQLRNSIDAVVRHYLGNDADTIVPAVMSAASLPNDSFGATSDPGQRLYSRADSAITDNLVAAHARMGVSLGAELSQPARLSRIAGDCATDGDTSNDAACLDALVRDLGFWTHRRPLDAAEIDFYRHTVYLDGDTITQQGVAELIETMFRQPNFVMHVEGTGDLTDYEVASRLSYQFWDSMPDQALFDAAEAHELLTDTGFRAQLERVLSDPRADAALSHFLDEWWKRDHAHAISDSHDPTLDVIAPTVTRDASLDAAVDAEIHDLFLYALHHGGTFRDFFLADSTTTSHPGLAAIYGVSPAVGGELVAVPPERVGILTRVAALIPRGDITPPLVGGGDTHPILRGVFVRRQILCDQIGNPPANAMMNLPSIDRAHVSPRVAADMLTLSGGSCVGCHTSLNAPGYALEQFDAVGQLRTEIQLFDFTTPSIRVPVDATAILAESGATVTGGADLSRVLYATERPSACFARNYVRYTLGRPESETTDGCLLHDVDEAIDADRPLMEVLGAAVLSPGFRYRSPN